MLSLVLAGIITGRVSAASGGSLPRPAEAVFSARASAARSPALVDINHATAEELRQLPGIRDAYAAVIMKNRPYDNKRQLLSRKILPVAAYEKIRTRIVARQ